jgi:tRNA A37 threonylcarbamoyladenosine biosynthesis protein TsaE
MDSSVVLEALGRSHHESEFQRIKENRLKGTGAWFTVSDYFKNWKQGKSRLLWLYGPPGCGKTYLCATIIEDLQERTQQGPPPTILYFFFQDRNESRTLKHFISSLILQLCKLNKGHRLEFFKHCQQTREDSPGSWSRTSWLLIDILKQMMLSADRVYIVLDGLGECEATDRVKLIEWIETTSAVQNIHLLVTSREDELDNKHREEREESLFRFLEAAKNSEIRHLISTRLAEIRRLREKLGAFGDVERALVKGSNGW